MATATEVSERAAIFQVFVPFLHICRVLKIIPRGSSNCFGPVVSDMVLLEFDGVHEKWLFLHIRSRARYVVRFNHQE